jgi:2-dehydro-3-deoxy-D-arabinonate dehydratase
MRFIQVAAESAMHFCLVDEDGEIKTLNNRPDDPGDYLQLCVQARARGQSTSAYAAGIATHGQQLPWSLSDLDVPPGSSHPYLAMPYVPPEVWGAAFSYPFRGRAVQDDPNAQERRAERPVIFFKATPHRCVGPNDSVGSRGDSTAMLPEPELGAVIASSGEVIGYTVVNDMTSRDMHQASLLYVAYAKTFTRCVSLGPAVAPPESIADPYNLDVRCRVTRKGMLLWDEKGNTSEMIRTFENLIRYLTSHNEIPTGTLLSCGSALVPPGDMHLVEGDWIEIEISGIGRLANSVVCV